MTLSPREAFRSRSPYFGAMLCPAVEVIGMENQLNLFDGDSDVRAKRLARSTDPETSKLVASDIATDGTVARLEKLVIETLLRHKDKTASEVSDIAGVPNLHKRFAGLMRKELIRITGVRRCTVSGRQAQTYCLRMD